MHFPECICRPPSGKTGDKEVLDSQRKGDAERVIKLAQIVTAICDTRAKASYHQCDKGGTAILGQNYCVHTAP